MTEAVDVIQPERSERRRKFINWLLLLLLLHAVGAVTVIGVCYATRNVPEKPPIFAPAGVSVPQYLFSIDGLAEPVAVAASPLGDLIFVAEGKGDHLIRIFDRDGKFLSAFDTSRAPLEYRVPDSLTVGPDNRLYIIDSFQNEVLIYSLNGEYIGTFLPDNDPDFDWAPRSLFIDYAGNFYFTDQTEYLHGVMVFDPDWNLIEKFGAAGKEDGLFLYPTDVMVDSNGWIYVADSANNRIQVFDSTGEFLNAIYGTDLTLPRALFQDNEGRLHVLDSLGHQIVGVVLSDPPGVQFRYGALGHGLGQLSFPNDLSRDETGRIYIADRFNNRIQVWSF